MLELSDDPGVTGDVKKRLEELALDHLVIIYPGTRAYSLAERVTVLPLARLAEGRQAVVSPEVR